MTVQLRRERRVALSYREVASSILSLDALIRLKGIDPARPYSQHDDPEMEVHVYIQRLDEIRGHCGN